MTFTGDTLPVQEVVRSVRTSVPVYNLTVEGTHTYFVGVGDGEAVLVHNTCAYRKGDALYEIGIYRELKAARQGNSAYKGLDAHHIPSKQFMKTYGIDPDDALSILPALPARLGHGLVRGLVFPEGTVDMAWTEEAVSVTVTASRAVNTSLLLRGEEKHRVILAAGESKNLRLAR